MTAMDAAAIAAEYDAVLYDGSTFEQTHPDHLAMMARLFGLDAPDIHTARVLELGCASGENLIPMAAQLPRASFYGLDLSARQIAAGREVVDALGLTNLRLEQRDLMDLGTADGPFDFIICHGVYSWVPDEVQKGILTRIRSLLSPTGVAFLSYNVYPGWHERSVARAIMRFASRTAAPPGERLERARRGLAFVARAAVDSDAPYARALRSASSDIERQSEGYVFHEHLEADNRPLWFHDFWGQLTSAGLSYLTDTHLGNSQPLTLPPDVLEELHALAPDLVSFEQYLDFLRNRPFRQSLIVHEGRTARRVPDPEALGGLHVIGAVSVTHGTEADRYSGAPMTFKDDYQTSLTSPHPAVKALMWEVAHAGPAGLSVPELWQRMLSVWPVSLERPSHDALSRLLLGLAGGRSVALRSGPPPVATALSPRPAASAVARYFASRSESVPNQRHRQVAVTPLGREVLRRLDGERSLQDVAGELAALTEQGHLQIGDPNRPMTGTMLRFTVLALVTQLTRQHLRDGLLVP